ncbi:MAG: hypothetical protein UR72_C0010G0009 [Parcubacteria group bacterium GW2011_GWC1_35_21]|nr:MAG: hypothetical protein UR72_C0010G0009 [Parcubacteria group bacterium GW2011_GWC1_35_21]
MEKAEQKEKENFEQKKVEVSPEKLSLSDIDELLGENVEVYNDLGSFYKTIDVFKNIDFKDNLKFKGVDVIDDKFDEAVYGKATLSEKILNFTTLGLAKKDLGLIKSKERGLLNKDIFNKEMEGKEIEIGQNKEERSDVEKIIGSMRKELSAEDLRGRRITKSFEFVDGKIIKKVQASRTEQGQIEAVVKLKDEKIKEADNFGVDLVKSKEQLKKHLNDKEKLENLKHLSAEGKEDLRRKMAEEEASLGNSIKDKEEELKDKLSIFKEPLEERAGQTKELLNKVSKAFEYADKEEAETNKNLKEIDSEIKLVEKSGILEGSKNQIIESLKAGRNEMANNLSEITFRKKALDNRLSVLKTNKQDLDKELSRMNKIGKTKEEIAEEEKVKKEENKKDMKDMNEDDTKEAGKKLQANEFAEDWSFMKEKRDSKVEPEADSEDSVEENESANKETENTAEKTFTEKEVEDIVKTHLKIIGSSKIKDKKIQEQITRNAIGNVLKMIEKTEEPITEIYIRKETKRVFDALSASYFKRNK